MHLYFNAHEYYRTLFTVLVAFIGTVLMVVSAVTAGIAQIPSAATSVVNVALTASFVCCAIMLMNLPRLRKLFIVRRTISQLMTILEDYTSGLEVGAEVNFPGTDGFMIEAQRRASGAFRLAVANDTGMRHMVVQRYRVDEGAEVGTLMALSQLGYLQSITRFIEVHAIMADRMSKPSDVSKVNQMLATSKS